MKKIIIVPVLSVLWVLILALAACERPSTPSNPYGRGGPTNLPEQHFSSALEAYNFAKKYFEEDAKYYETIQYGDATPTGIGGVVAGSLLNYTRRNLTASGDFLYEMANYADSTVGGVETRFAFVAVQKATDSGFRFAREDGDNRIRRNGRTLHSDFSDIGYDGLTALSQSEFESTCGFNPRKLSSYIVNSGTIISSTAPQRVNTPLLNGYTFSIQLNSGSFEAYKKQVTYAGGQEYRSFSSLKLEICVDIYGRMVELKINEKYSVTAMGRSQAVEAKGTQYFTYDKSATIDFSTLTASYPAQ